MFALSFCEMTICIRRLRLDGRAASGCITRKCHRRVTSLSGTAHVYMVQTGTAFITSQTRLRSGAARDECNRMYSQTTTAVLTMQRVLRCVSLISATCRQMLQACARSCRHATHTAPVGSRLEQHNAVTFAHATSNVTDANCNGATTTLSNWRRRRRRQRRRRQQQ